MARRPDPIIDEIRRIRDTYAASFDYDLKRIVHDLQRQQKESGRTYVSLPPRRPASFPLREVPSTCKPDDESR